MAIPVPIPNRPIPAEKNWLLKKVPLGSLRMAIDKSLKQIKIMREAGTF